jgi:predicted metal-dependent phosphoesterase TrpH
MLLDLHVHTNISWDGKIKIGNLLRKLKEIGLDGIAITDHNSYEAIPKAKEIAVKYDVKVFQGIEISSKDGHILAYGVEEKPPYKKSVEETIEWIHDNGGAAVCAHPFSLTSPSMGEDVYHNKFDALEINASCTQSSNHAAELAARLMNVHLVGGSDAHYLNSVGLVTTFFYDEITNEDELIAAIKKGNCEVRYRIPITIQAELIPPIPDEELSLMDKFIEDKKQPEIPIIVEVVNGKSVRFFDNNSSK